MFCSSQGTNVLSSLMMLHHASCRTLEQQGREDDEGKGWRLAVDVKSDLC
jgi:hypothetical protein